MTEIKRRISIGKILIHSFLVLWALGCLYPFLWVIINSFKDKDSILINSFSFPFKNFTLENYQNALGKYNIFTSYLNSFIISGSVVVLVLIITTFASYALARFNFFGKKFVFALLIASMMFPIFSTIFPLFRMLVQMKLNGTRLGIILPQTAGNLGFATILVTGFMQNIPKEVEESAYLDGASNLQTLYYLIVPMSKPVYSTSAIFVFIWSYNDLFMQMLILGGNEDRMPITALLRLIHSKEKGTDWGLMVAAVALIAIPVVVLYFFLQKNIIKGLTAGAIKG